MPEVQLLILARTGLTLEASKSDPSVKRWQRNGADAPTGGRTIGKTKSGKPVFATPTAENTAGYSASDHLDAAIKHTAGVGGSAEGAKFHQQAFAKAPAAQQQSAVPQVHRGAPQGQAQAKPSAPPAAPQPVDPDRLPDRVTQAVTDPTTLFTQAAAAHEAQVQVLDDGQGIDKAIGATSVRLDKGEFDKLGDAMDEPGPVVVIGPTKTMERSAQKVRDDYKGDWSQLKDAVRASVAVDTYDEIPGLVKKLKAAGVTLAAKPKDRFEKPTDVGYRDMLWNVRWPNGHIGELQLHVKSMLNAKERGGGHKLLEKLRPIEEAATARAREAGRGGHADPVDVGAHMTPGEREHYQEIRGRMESLYNQAWEQAQGDGRSMRKAVDAELRFFKIDHFPVYQRDGDLPVVIRDAGKELLDLDEFFHDAIPIDRAEYDRLRRALAAPTPDPMTPGPPAAPGQPPDQPTPKQGEGAAADAGSPPGRPPQ